MFFRPPAKGLAGFSQQAASHRFLLAKRIGWQANGNYHFFIDIVGESAYKIGCCGIRFKDSPNASDTATVRLICPAGKLFGSVGAGWLPDTFNCTHPYEWNGSEQLRRDYRRL